jgi:iron(III) transport system ATP-binding protein
LLYPNQIKIVEKPGLIVEVKATYFKGSYYLIEAILNNKTLYFEHFEKLEINQ